MASPRKTPVTAFSVPVSVRDVINRTALDLSAALGRRVSMAAVVAAAVEVANMHPDELRKVLAPSSAPEPPDGAS